MTRGISGLVGADEQLSHQIVDSFAAVGTSELSWTEKIWSTFVRKDGGLQVDFGVGKYANRNVIDSFGGVARGREQWTVRASRELDRDPELIGAGPLSYEIIEPLKTVRMTLAPNDVLPVSYDLTFQHAMPAFFEDRDVQYDRGRRIMDVLRYHQGGTATGWIEVDGERHEVTPDGWFAYRDRSWGVRQYVGERAPDLQPDTKDWLVQRFHFNWLPAILETPDGDRYGLHYYLRDTPAGPHLTGHINHRDGSQTRLREVRSDLRYVDSTRDVAGGTVTVVLDDAAATERTFEIEPLGETGFRLWPALYYPWKGLTHGTWKGPLHVDGEHIEDCPAAFDAVENPIWQTRDRPVRVREGDAVGYAILESSLIGDWPERLVPAHQAAHAGSQA